MTAEVLDKLANNLGVVSGITLVAADVKKKLHLQGRHGGQPTINIQGLVGGYTGAGGKTILPTRAAAKIDMRLVPDMTAKGTLQLLKDHLAKHGYGDIEVNMTGGYNPTMTPPDARLVKAMVTTYNKSNVNPMLWPRLAGSWPGVTFTGPPLNLPAGQFGMRHRRRRPRAKRVLADRIVQPEGRGHGRSREVARGPVLRAGLKAIAKRVDDRTQPT